MEVGRRVEILVDTGEAQIRNLVDHTKLLEHSNTDVGTRHRRTEQPHGVFDLCGDDAQSFGGHVAALGRRSKTTDQLAAVEWLTSTIGLQHGERNVIDSLVGREPLRTRQTLAPTANRRTFLCHSRVDDLGVISTTSGTEHLLRVVR